MTTLIVSDTNFDDPTNLIPFLEKDDAIIRNVTMSMLDFSNSASLSVTGAISAGTAVTSLTSDAQTGSAVTALPAQADGLVDFGGSGLYMKLPDNFKLVNGVKRFMVIVWVKLPATGYQTAAGNTSQAVISNASNTSSLAQWFVNLITVQATGVPNVVQCGFPSNGSARSVSMPNSETLALCDGALHQLALYFDGEGVGTGMSQGSAWIDGVQKVASSIVAWDGTIQQPASEPRLASQVAYQSSYPAGSKLGRPSMWNLTGTAWTPQQILQRDRDAAQGYLS